MDNPTFVYKSSDATVIAFNAGDTYAAEGALSKIKFLKAGTATLTVQYAGTDDLATSSVDLAVTVAEPATLTLASNNETLGTMELVMPESGLQVEQVTQAMVANGWEGNQTLLTADYLPGFQEVSPEKAHAWTGAPTGEYVASILYYAFDGDEAKCADYTNGSYDNYDEVENIVLGHVFNQFTNLSSHVYYTTGYALAAIIDNGNGTYSIIPGTEVTLKATATDGNELKEWTGADLTDNQDGTWTLTIDQTTTLTATFDEKSYSVELVDGTEDPAGWKGNVDDAEQVVSLPFEAKAKQKVTLKYEGRRKVREVQAITDAVPPTLADALKNGAVVKIDYTWDGNIITSFTFTNDNGNYSCSITGTEAASFANSSLTIDGSKLVFQAVNEDDDNANVTIQFYPSDDAFYIASKGLYYTSFTISVNGTDIKSQLSELK